MREESYIVRIYRRGRRGQAVLIGLVETPGNGWQKPFRSPAELAAIFAAPSARAVRNPAPKIITERRRR